ncbi:MAG: lytic murein transglycosylase [Sphingobium sp.]|nr:lytic murein transglycosylase [Sphingobium sp.]
MRGSLRFSRFTSALCAGFALGLCPLSAASAQSINFGEPGAVVQPSPNSFAGYIAGLREKARALGVSDQTFDRATATLTANDRVVMLDRGAGPVSLDAPIPDFEPYRRQHVTPALIGRGRTVYAANRALLSRFEAETGVPEGIMVAIFGHETSYGSVNGSFDLIRSLATLAYEGRRRALFEPELLAAMQMMEKGVPREKLVGSYAGATGYPQFLPSVYLRDARDADGDGFADIWASQPDGLASIAGYFERAGWRKGEPWGFAVSVPAGFDRNAVEGKTTAPRCPRVFDRHSKWLSMVEWRALGIAPTGTAWPDDKMMATLLEPDGPGKTAYLLTSNYRVILDYNCSNFYALSVGLLADAVSQ